MKANIELTPAVLQACLLGKRLSAHNGNTDSGRVINSVRTIDCRKDGSVYCYGMINDVRSIYILIPRTVLQSLLEEHVATVTYTNKTGKEYACQWFLK